MPRMSELTRKPSLTALLPQPVLELEYFSELKNPVVLPSLPKAQQAVGFPGGSTIEGGSLEKLLEQEFARLAVSLSHDEPLSVDGMRAIAGRLVQEVHRSDQLVAQVFAARPLSSRLVSNALNVAVLATKLGMGLQYVAEDLNDVALAALAHDLGKLMQPRALGGKTKRPSSKDAQRPSEHAVFAQKIFSNLTDHSWVGEVAGQVYERWDGQGTPNGLKGTAIHEYAQVIGVADRFETLINEKGLTAHEAMQRLLTKEKAAFRGSLLKTLVQQISLFPVGTVVRLNTGEVGTVEQTNPDHPLRPILRMVSGDHRAASEVAPLKDLSQDMFVHIEKAIRDPQ